MTKGYRIVCDENIERGTINYLRSLGHDVVTVRDVDELGVKTPDEEIAAYSERTNRLLLSKDDDFFTEIDPEETAGVLSQRDTSLSEREVGDIIEEMSRLIPQEEVTLEYVTTEWL